MTINEFYLKFNFLDDGVYLVLKNKELLINFIPTILDNKNGAFTNSDWIA